MITNRFAVICEVVSVISGGTAGASGESSPGYRRKFCQLTEMDVMSPRSGLTAVESRPNSLDRSEVYGYQAPAIGAVRSLVNRTRVGPNVGINATTPSRPIQLTDSWVHGRPRARSPDRRWAAFGHDQHTTTRVRGL